jgi:hypothetical protein
MDDWREFFWTVVASSAGTTTLLAAAAWLFKGQISHWLNKDLEATKAQHQRDLEAYKTSLIAAAERAKAAQEIKRSAALKMMEMRIDALKKLYDARRGLGSYVLGNVRTAVAWKTRERLDKSIERLDQYTEAMTEIELLIDNAEYRVLIDYRGQLMKAIDLCTPGVPPPPDEAYAALSHSVLSAEVSADRMIQAQLKKFESLD